MSASNGKPAFRSPKWAYTGGAVAVLVVFAVKFLIGGVYGPGQAIQLIDALQSSSLYFGAAIATASSTTLALMLTLLSFARKSDEDFDGWVFHSVNRICTVSALTMIGAVALLLLLQMASRHRRQSLAKQSQTETESQTESPSHGPVPRPSRRGVGSVKAKCKAQRPS